jgi:hypothetical protein
MCLVDNDQIVLRARLIHRACATEALEAEKIRGRLSHHERLSPHGGERGGCNDQAAWIAAGECRRDESLAHADVVADENAAKLLERCLRPADRRLLMWPQCYSTESCAGLTFSENNLRNSGANLGRRL